jgi:ribosomal protein S18 acetylase RimI-like enzyme
LAVLPRYRQKGYGRALVQHGFAEATKRDANRVEIAIIAQQTELKIWYEKFGFTAFRTKTFEHLPFDVTFMFINLPYRI